LDTFESFESQLYSVNENNFDNIALELFSFQARHNPVYKAWLSRLGFNHLRLTSVDDIPFMPISFFKQHTVKTGAWKEETVFTSSGTTGNVASAHHIYNLLFYFRHAEKCFRHFFGPLDQYHILALLPSYLERKNSSLVAMIAHFISRSTSKLSGFYLHDTDKLLADIDKIRAENGKIVLFGVSFALLDLSESMGPDLSGCLIIETGGMKGRRREITRTELHSVLRAALNVPVIHSEYGMTELLSQAYTSGGERFFSPKFLKILGRDLSDPFEKGLLNETAGINVIDLANWHSVAFIETEDLGKVYSDGSFEVLGRIDNSEVRGCNLLIG
jgi:hypothetical protein